MDDTWTGGEREMLAVLREAFVDECVVPPEVVRAAYGAFSWRTIEVEVGDGELLGQVVPAPEEARMQVTLQDGTTTSVDVDDLGCFAIRPIPGVPFRLHLSNGSSVVTDWIRI